MAGKDEFTGILMALQGVTVLETPRVSRETMIETMREHTLILREMKKGLGNVTQIVTSLAAEAGDNRRLLQNIQDENKKQRVDIDKLYALSDEQRLEMKELGDKVTELYALKADVKQQKEAHEDLNRRFEKHAASFDDYSSLTDRTILALDKKAEDTIFKLKELKDYVEHFADNLILPSSQITVEAVAGFGSRPMPLLEVLKTQNSQNTDSNATLKTHTDLIKESQDKIETKADDSLVHEVNGISRKVTAIENHILKEEEQGVGAIRRATEDLADKMQGMSTEMAEKMDRREVSFIVHEKYEEIVKYLQDALQSSTEDEQNFKLKAEEIQNMVMTLTNTKADRVEIAPMQEILVKTENMMKKLNANNKSREGFSKKEIETMMGLKVDKLEFEQQLQSMLKGSKKNKRLAALGQNMSSVHDEANLGGRPEQSLHPHPQDVMRDKQMWKGIAENLKDESEEAILRAAYKAHTAGGGNTSDFSAFVLSKKAQNANKNIDKMSLPSQSAQPGGFKGNSEAGQASKGNYSPANFDLSRPTTSERPGSNQQAGGTVGGGAGVDVYNTQQAGFPSAPFPPNQPEEHIPDMSFIGAQVAGGGFNQREGGLAHGTMKPLLDSQPTGDLAAVEGREIKYKMDGQTVVQQPTAVSKPINPKK
jgi:hypothetical protein